jgi:hypothetical protein
MVATKSAGHNLAQSPEARSWPKSGSRPVRPLGGLTGPRVRRQKRRCQPDVVLVRARKHDSGAGVSAPWVSLSSGDRIPAHRVQLAQVSGGRRDPRHEKRMGHLHHRDPRCRLGSSLDHLRAAASSCAPRLRPPGRSRFPTSAERLLPRVRRARLPRARTQPGRHVELGSSAGRAVPAPATGGEHYELVKFLDA